MLCVFVSFLRGLKKAPPTEVTGVCELLDIGAVSPLDEWQVLLPFKPFL